MLYDRACSEQLPIKLVAILEASRRHASRRADAVRGLVRVRDVERPMFTAEKACGRERLDFLAFADVEALADVDEGGHCGIQWPQRARDDRPKVRAGDGLRRLIARVPVELMPRVKDEAQVACRVTADQCATIHHLGDSLQAPGKLDVIDHGVDLRERAEDVRRLDAFLE